MPIYFGSNKLKELQFGTDKIKEVYYGSQLVFKKSSPEPESNEYNKIAVSYSTTWFVDDNGDLYGCGQGSYGQQGQGGSIKDNVLTFTKRMSNIKEVQSDCNGTATWCLSNDGTLYGTGSGAGGAFGLRTTTTLYSFTSIATNVKSFSTWENNNCAYITNDGELWLSGRNSYYQRGDGTATTLVKSYFSLVNTNVKKVKCTAQTTVYLTNDGNLYCAGGGGVPSSSAITVFTQVASNVRDFDSSAYTLFYIDNNDDLYGCGVGAYGQQGSGGTTAVTSFTKRASNVKKVKVSAFVSMYVTNDNDLYMCGSNTYGDQADGTTTNVTTFKKRASGVVNFGTGQFLNRTTTKITSYTTPWYTNAAGELYMCGDGQYGALGNNSTTAANKTFKKVPNIPAVKNVGAGTYGTWITSTGFDLYGCGQNSYGQQGSGAVSSSPITNMMKRL